MLITKCLGAGLVVLAFAGSGCAGLDKIDADTSCKDFLHASSSAQDDAVSKVASDVGSANAVTPLGRPNINYLCANHPDMTLGQAVRATR